MSDPITPNMGLTNPVPSSTPGPQYATEISADINILDAHDHTSGKGVQITPLAIDINDDLIFQSNNATNLRSTRYINNPTTLGGVGDINCVYDHNGDLWFNNDSGTPIQLTAGSVPAVAPTVVYSLFAVSGNYAITPTDPYVLIECDTSSTSITITLPLVSSVENGRLYIIKDSSGNSVTHHITVNPSGSDTLDGVASLTIADPFWSVGFVSNGTSNWNLLKWNKTVYLSGESLTLNSSSTLTANNGSTAIFNGILAAGSSSSSAFNGFLEINGLLSYGVVAVNGSNSPYTISSTLPVSASSLYFVVATSSASRTINLPAVSSSPSGMIIVIKDNQGAAATHNVSIVPNGSDTIEKLNTTYLLQTNFGSLTLISDGSISSNWSII